MRETRIVALAVFLAALLVAALILASLLAMRHGDGILVSAIGKHHPTLSGSS
jgi:hypothetical protein